MIGIFQNSSGGAYVLGFEMLRLPLVKYISIIKPPHHIFSPTPQPNHYLYTYAPAPPTNSPKPLSRTTRNSSNNNKKITVEDGVWYVIPIVCFTLYLFLTCH